MTDIVLLINIFATYLIFIFIPLGLWLVLKKNRPAIFHMLTSVLLAVTFCLIIKYFYYLPRPFILSGRLPLVDFGLDGSFPSAHTAISFAFSLSLLKYYQKLSLVLLFTSALIAFGRISGGVHTLIDVSAGVLIALLSVLIAKKYIRD